MVPLVLTHSHMVTKLRSPNAGNFLLARKNSPGTSSAVYPVDNWTQLWGSTLGHPSQAVYSLAGFLNKPAALHQIWVSLFSEGLLFLVGLKGNRNQRKTIFLGV